MVRDARFWCRKLTEDREIAPLFRNPTTGKLCPPSNKWYLFRIREGQGSKWREMGSIFHQLCSRYSRPLTLTIPKAIRLRETKLFVEKILHLRAPTLAPSCYSYKTESRSINLNSHLHFCCHIYSCKVDEACQPVEEVSRGQESLMSTPTYPYALSTLMEDVIGKLD